MLKKSLSLFCSFVFLWNAVFAQNITQTIHANWLFRHAGGNGEWYKATVPGTIHTDLIANHLIDDPFYRDNEQKIQWISTTNWEYTGNFDVSPAILHKPHIQLVFDGLDTYAEVYFNNNLVLKANNMFRTWTVDVKPFITLQHNVIHIIFRSAKNITDSLATDALPLLRPCENNRHYARKAQYNFGWDWAPTMITCGIWRPIHIEAFDKFSDREARYMREDSQSGVKKNNVQLVQQKDSIGESFYFTVNGKPTFMKGANWVPADVFLPRITHEKYRNLLIAAKEAGINMLRVWGGGIYEDDYFYDLCDSLHINIWQEFMFAGAMYPADTASLENIKQEVIDNIRRLRHHPCIVMWCGNNEIDEGWQNWGWKKGKSPEDSAQLWDDYKRIFHQLLPQLVKQYDSRPYITTSPLFGGGHKESLTTADSHIWSVWGGGQPIELYKEKIPRFASEYGMQAMPNWETIEQFSLPGDWDTASTVMKVHQKHITGYQNIAVYINQLQLHPHTFQEYVAATQEIQSKALETAITAHMHAQPRCMGTLFWQFNDCWPVASWSVVDYYGRKKKAYYTVQKLYTHQP